MKIKIQSINGYKTIILGNLCLFCQEPKKIYKPFDDGDFVCRSCSSIIKRATPEERKRAYRKAKKLGGYGQPKALAKFIFEEDIKGNDDKTEKTGRNLVREKTMQLARPSRDKFRS